jgi:hypothetical protein
MLYIYMDISKINLEEKFIKITHICWLLNNQIFFNNTIFKIIIKKLLQKLDIDLSVCGRENINNIIFIKYMIKVLIIFMANYLGHKDFLDSFMEGIYNISESVHNKTSQFFSKFPNTKTISKFDKILFYMNNANYPYKIQFKEEFKDETFGFKEPKEEFKTLFGECNKESNIIARTFNNSINLTNLIESPIVAELNSIGACVPEESRVNLNSRKNEPINFFYIPIYLPQGMIDMTQLYFDILSDIMICNSIQKLRKYIPKLKELLLNIVIESAKIVITNKVYENDIYKFFCNISMISSLLEIDKFTKCIDILNKIFKNKYIKCIKRLITLLTNIQETANMNSRNIQYYVYNLHWRFNEYTLSLFSKNRSAWDNPNELQNLRINNIHQYIMVLRDIIFINALNQITSENRIFFTQILEKYVNCDVLWSIQSEFPEEQKILYSKLFREKKYTECLTLLNNIVHNNGYIIEILKYIEGIKTYNNSRNPAILNNPKNIKMQLKDYAKQTFRYDIYELTLTILNINIKNDLITNSIFIQPIVVSNEKIQPTKSVKQSQPQQHKPSFGTLSSTGASIVSPNGNIELLNGVTSTTKTQINIRKIYSHVKNAETSITVDEKWFEQFKGINFLGENLFEDNGKINVTLYKDPTNIYIKIYYNRIQICHTSFHYNIPGNYRLHIKLDKINNKSYLVKYIINVRSNGAKSVLITRDNIQTIDNQQLFDLMINIASYVLTTLI